MLTLSLNLYIFLSMEFRMRASVNHGNGLFWISINHVQCHCNKKAPYSLRKTQTHTKVPSYRKQKKVWWMYIKIVVKCNYNNRNGIITQMCSEWEQELNARDSLEIGECFRFNRQQHHIQNKWMRCISTQTHRMRSGSLLLSLGQWAWVM